MSVFKFVTRLHSRYKTLGAPKITDFVDLTSPTGIPHLFDGVWWSVSMYGFALCRFLSSFLPFWMAIFVWLFIGPWFNPMKSDARRLMWMVFLNITFMIDYINLAIVVATILVLWENGTLNETLIEWLDFIEEYFCLLVECKPIFTLSGGNSDGQLVHALGFIDEVYSRFVDQYFYFTSSMAKGFSYTEAEFIRSEVCSVVPIDKTTAEFLSPRVAEDGYWSAKRTKHTVLITLFAVICMIIFSCANIILVLLSCLALYISSNLRLQFELSHELPMLKDGVYRLRTYTFGLVDHSIGIVEGGTLHAAHHAVGVSPLIVGSRGSRPTYANQELDITTWFGRPRLSDVDDGDEVIVNIHREVGQWSYRVEVQKQDGSISWPSVTESGDSGSPVYKVDGEQKKLVALAGLYYGTRENLTEFRSKIDRNVIPDFTHAETSKGLDEVHYVTQHPGGGKTHVWIPEKVTALLKLPRRKRGVIVVAGPTRPVCNEIKNSLLKKIPADQITMFVKNSQMNTRTVRDVVIVTHNTLMQMVVSSKVFVRRIGSLILDESHFDDVGTHFAKEYGRTLALNGKEVYFLSATHEHEMSEDSNYAIIDKQINEDKIAEVARREVLDEGHRVAIFLPTVEGKRGIKYYKDKLKDLKPVELHRETFEHVKKSLMDIETRLILTTNIAECGVNLNIDTVIDSSRNFYYEYIGNRIHGVNTIITESSRIQRRGRVGRRKVGKYFYTEHARGRVKNDTANNYDANIILRSMPWYSKKDFAPDIQLLSAAQINKAFQRNIPPNLAGLIYDEFGNETKDSDRVEAWLRGRVSVNSCQKGDPKCACIGDYLWWDERIHDELVRLKLGTFFAPKKRYFSI